MGTQQNVSSLILILIAASAAGIATDILLKAYTPLELAGRILVCGFVGFLVGMTYNRRVTINN